MSAPQYIADSLQKKVIFFTGKGGVGKSTLLWSLASLLAQKGKKVAVAAWSESSQAPDAFPRDIHWVPLETLQCFRDYVLQVVRFERLYDTIFDNKVLRTFVLAAPGLSDTVIAGKIWELYRRQTYDILLVDLPSSGHALSFFHSPLGVKKVFGSGFVHQETTRICEMLAASDVRLDLVALPEELPVVECLELKEKLEQLHTFRFGFLWLNQMLPRFGKLLSERNSLPKDCMTMVDDYAVRWQRQEQNRTMALKANLPLVEVGKFTTPDEQTLIQRVVQQFIQEEALSA